MIKQIKRLILDKRIRFGYLSQLGILNIISDKKYLEEEYKIATGKKIDIDNPKTFNEKLQWLKLYDRQPIYTTLVDKYAVKKYVSDAIGSKYIIQTIGIYENFNDIDFNKLPNRFVIKCTHDSGGIVICKNKKNLNLKQAKKLITRHLRRKFYYIHREWPYKNVKPRIIIEKYLEDSSNKEMRDYKIFCFNGEPRIAYVSDDSHTEHQKIAFFDMDFNYLNIKRKDYEDYGELPKKPQNWKKMKELSAKLSNDIPHVRVDWYEINGKLYFGEFTFYTGSGFIPFTDDKWNKKLGDMIDLSLVKKK